jgi:tetratricopeptide (TPR) repeat protein
MLRVVPPSNHEWTAWLERSRETLARAARLVRADAYGWANLAVPEARLAAAGRLEHDQPFRSLDEALRLDPANVTFRLAGANTALELGDLERARRYAAGAAGMLPDFAPARAQLAHVAAREGRLEEAIGLLREAQGLEWYGLTEAEQVARALVRESPSFAPGRYQLGRVLEALGQSAEAITGYEATLRLDPSHRGARGRLRRTGARGPGSPGNRR